LAPKLIQMSYILSLKVSC